MNAKTDKTKLPKAGATGAIGGPIVEWSLDPIDDAERLALQASCGRGDGDISFDEPERRR